ncbi:MAG: arylsulfatase, partial [Pirellulales bacterium]
PPLPSLPGRSLVPAFSPGGRVARDYLWWYHEGNRAVRLGDWKLVAAGEDGPWELYDLSSDRTETNNLADRYPSKLEELRRTWNGYRDAFLELARRDLPGK